MPNMKEAAISSSAVDNNDKNEPPAPLLDLEASPLQGLLASAVLDRQGDLVRGGLTVPADASILFQMLSEVGSLPQQQQIHSSFRRLTVSFPSRNFRYILSRDETHVYIVQVKKSMG